MRKVSISAGRGAGWSVVALFAGLSALAGCGGGMMPEDAGGFDGSRQDASCVTGELGCACDGQSCVGGTCVRGVCTDCAVGAQGCACRSDMTCSAGSSCELPDGICGPCVAGEEGCPCGAGCASGLVCQAEVCVPDDCRDGVVGCLCAATEPRCEAGAFCDGTRCQSCTAEVAGCPCEAGLCRGGLVCDVGSCREPLDCGALRATGACGELERCDERAGADAVCFPGECRAGYRFSVTAETCVACVSEGCVAEPTCEPGLPTSLDCEPLNRICVESDGAGECGACEAGYLDVMGECLESDLCGGVDCGASQYCDRAAAGGPRCAERPCGAGTTVQAASGACTVHCTRSCSGPGLTGRLWPFATRDDECVCETEPGWYFEAGAVSEAALCDADRDGWVRNVVRVILDGGDAALVANARCVIRSADAVVLVDEHGIETVIESCQEGLLQDRTEGTCEAFPLRLFETKRNDVEGEAERIAAATGVDRAPPYATSAEVSRRFRVNELNALTKACVSRNGDFDDDGREDVLQFQPRPASTSSLGEGERLRAFAHFVEVYRTSWRPPSPGTPYGRLVIAERSRCQARFPLGYGTDTGYVPDPDDGSSHWRNCTRRRHPQFSAGSNAPGFDFAQWSCGTRTGTCPLPPVPANATYATAPDPNAALVRDHGACALAGARPADGIWRGMLHHSQFQCVEIVDDGTRVEPYHREQAVFRGTAGSAVFNECRLIECAGAAGCTDSDAPSSRPGAYDPRIRCEHQVGRTPAVGAVGWAALRYRAYGHVGTSGALEDDRVYEGGCVNEDAEYPDLCPYPDFGRCETAPEDAFGRYRCFGWDALFLWGSDEEPESLRRNVLAWAPAVDPAVNMSVFAPESGATCE